VDLPLQRREQQPLEPVQIRFEEEFARTLGVAGNPEPLDRLRDPLRVDGDFDTQLLFGDAAHQGEVAVGGDGGNPLAFARELGVQAVLLEPLGPFDLERGVLHHLPPPVVPLARIVAVALGEDVLRPLDRFIHRFHRTFDELRRFLEKLPLLEPSTLQHIRQRFQSRGDRARGAGVFLLFVGAVEILDLLQTRRRVEAGAHLIAQMPPLGDEAQHLLLAFQQSFGVAVHLLERTQLLVARTPRHLLAVAGDEGDRGTLFEEPQDIGDVFGGDIRFLAEKVDQRGHRNPAVVKLGGEVYSVLVKLTYFSV